MNVRIIMARSPSPTNKRLLTFLHDNVMKFKSSLQMNITTVSKSDQPQLDAAITKLPAAYVGTRVVMGNKNIADAIRTAFEQSRIARPDDPVRNFMDKAIMEGMDSKESINPGNELSKQFTAASQSRKISMEATKPKNKFGKSKPQQAPNKPQSTTPFATEAGASTSYTDPNRPSTFESDPIMKMYWENQETTPGV